MTIPQVVDGVTDADAAFMNQLVDAANQANAAFNGAGQITTAAITPALEEAYDDPSSVLGSLRASADRADERGTLVFSPYSYDGDLQATIDAATAAGGRVVAAGVFTINTTLTITCNADFTAATVLVNDKTINPAIRVGTTVSGSLVEDLQVILPKLIQQDKVANAGWVGSDTGVELANLYTSRVTIPRVEDFKTGVRLVSYGVGCVYNDIVVGYLRNNKVGLHLKPESGGWIAETTFYGGRWTIRSGEGSNITDARYILLDGTNNTINGTLWLKPSLEGNGPEFHVEFIKANFNTIFWPRCEATSWKLQFNGAVTSQNMMIGGTDTGVVAVTEINGAQRNSAILPTQTIVSTGDGTHATVRLQNGTSGGKAIVVMANDATLATDENTAYAAAILPNFSYYKRSGDAYNRIELEHRNARVKMGGGSGATDLEYGRFAANAFGVAADDVLRTGSGVTGSRPSASDVGAGSVWFDTTIGKPIWSTGSSWVLADGSAA